MNIYLNQLTFTYELCNAPTFLHNVMGALQISLMMYDIWYDMNQPGSSLSDFTQPTKFKLVVQAAKECEGFCETEYQKPS